MLYVWRNFPFLTVFNRHFSEKFDVERGNKIEHVDKPTGKSNLQYRENLIETVVVTVLQALNGNVAVVTSSDMLISQIAIAVLYNELMNYEYEDNMFSRMKTSIGLAETYFIPEFSWSNMAAAAILKCKISIGS